MINYILEKYRQLKGERKLGVRISRLMVIEGDHLESEVKLKKIRTVLSDIRLGYENFYNQFQGIKPWCVAYTIAHSLSFFLTRKYKEMITIDAKEIAKILIEARILDEDGARIDDSVDYITKYSRAKGLFDKRGRRYRINEYKVYKRELIPEILDKGYSIVFGSLIRSPMCDKDHFLRPANYQNTRGGHAYLGVPKKTVLTDESIPFENSWKKWGIPYKSGLKSGQGKIHKKDINKLFTPHVFTDVERVEE